MATQLLASTGNLSGGVFVTCNSTAELDSETGTTAPTTSPVASSAFTPGVITVAGVAIKLATRVGSPTGTITVELYNSTGSLSIASTTINVSDLPASGNGWQYFKFGSSVTLLGVTNYVIRVSTSSSAQCTLYRDSTAANWSRQLVTTTGPGGAPSAGDKLIICGDLTGAGTSNAHTLTWDDTANTSYGTTALIQSITINNGGTLTMGASASTAYTMKFAGILACYGGGTYNLGKVGTPIPSTSTVTVLFDQTANVDSGIVINGGTWVGRGNSLTTVWDRLAVDAAASATSLTTVSSTGWLNGDVLAFSSTTTNSSQAESKALTAGASGTTLTIAALTNAHSGTNNANGDIRCEVGNLTRNVKITGTSTTFQGYILCAGNSVIDIQYVEFTQLGSGSGNKRGIDLVLGTTGTVNFQFNSIHDFIVSASQGLNLSAASGTNHTLSNNVFYNTASNCLNIAATSQVHTIDSNLFIRSSTADNINLNDIGCTFTNNYSTSSAIAGATVFEQSATLGTFSGNVFHSNSAAGANLNATGSGTFLNCRVWRNNSNTGGVLLQAQNGAPNNITIDGLIAFGNATAGVGTATGLVSGWLTITNSTFNAGVTLVQPQGLSFFGCLSVLNIENTTFGGTNTFSAGDITLQNIGFFQIYCRNVLMASTTEVVNPSNMRIGSFVSSEKHDQTAGNHKTWSQYGLATIDTTIFNTASPSLRLTPVSATNKLESGPALRGWKIAVANGQTLTPTVFIRKSVVGDGTAYNGNQPRLIVRKNTAIGISADTVLATYSSAAGSWNSISGTTVSATDDGTMEFIIDCDGTTGWINIDDLTVA